MSDHVAAPSQEHILRAVIDLIRSFGNKKAAANADAALDVLLAERVEWEAEAHRSKWPKEAAREYHALKAQVSVLLAERQRLAEALERIASGARFTETPDLLDRSFAELQAQGMMDTARAALTFVPSVLPPYHPDVIASARAAASAVRDPSQDRETPIAVGGAGVIAPCSAAPTSPDDCPTCHGASTVDPDPDCPTCGGEGEIPAAAVREPAPPPAPDVYLPPVIGPAPLQETPE